MTELSIKEILKLRTIAVVGCSNTPGKPGHDIPSYLKGNGYEVIPVNPNAQEVLGEKSYPALLDIPPQRGVDIVEVFRPSIDVPGIVEQVLQMKQKPKVLWLQTGIRDDSSAEKARKSDITVVQDKCLMVEHAASV